MLLFLVNAVYSLSSSACPPRPTRGSRSRSSGPCRRPFRSTTSSTSRVSTPIPTPTARRRHRRSAADSRRRREPERCFLCQWQNPPRAPLVPPPYRWAWRFRPSPPHVAARTLAVASRLLCGSTDLLLPRIRVCLLLPALARSRTACGAPAACAPPSQGLGAAFIACIVLSAAFAIVAGRSDEG